MRYGSLFAGIGGIDLGLERAGMECAWQVENDPYCIKVLEKHWPNTPQVAEWIGERIMEHTFLDDRTGVTGIDGRGRKTSRLYAGSTPATSTRADAGADGNCVGGVSDMASSSFLSRWGCCAVLKAPVGFDPPTAHCGVRPPRDNRIRVRRHGSCFSWRTPR